MINWARRVRVYAYGEPADMRKSFDTLSAIVREQIKHDVLDGALYVFVGKDCRRAKVLFWDGTGLCVFAKRLERDASQRPGHARTSRCSTGRRASSRSFSRAASSLVG